MNEGQGEAAIGVGDGLGLSVSLLPQLSVGVINTMKH